MLRSMATLQHGAQKLCAQVTRSLIAGEAMCCTCTAFSCGTVAARRYAFHQASIISMPQLSSVKSVPCIGADEHR